MLFLTRDQVASALDVDRLIDALEEGFVDISAGRTSVPPRVAAFAPGGLLGAMPGFAAGALAAKLVSVFPANHEKGMPSHQALIVLFDETSGSPLAIMDGTRITAIRTAAASAVSVRALARKDASVLAIIGAGVQGRSHLEAVPRIRQFSEIRVASRNFLNAQMLAKESGGTAVETFREAIEGAGVVCVCTDTVDPIIDRGWISPGTHVTSVGGSPRGRGELDHETLLAGLLVVESKTAFQPAPAGAADLNGIDPSQGVELGEILSGAHPGRNNADQITVYKSMGHAMEDAVAARLSYERAVTAGIGTEIAL